ncbi:MAG: tetratricopeptide repeat protein [Elusimicrobia bacterium]|nr:tetratricopeptide repeat protein [Elusimicrobiota bacterium]
MKKAIAALVASLVLAMLLPVPDLTGAADTLNPPPVNEQNAPQGWENFFKQAWDAYTSKKLKKSLGLVRDAQGIFDRQKERPMADLAEMLNLESLILRSLSRHREASQICERLTKIDQKRLKSPDPLLSVDYECLGETYEKTNRHEMALKAYKKALAMREELPQTPPVVVRRLRRIINRLSSHEARETPGASPASDADQEKSFALDAALVKKIKKICRGLNEEKLAAKLRLASQEILIFAEQAEAGRFFPESVVVGGFEGNLFSAEPLVELACRGESRPLCAHYRDDLDRRMRQIIFLRGVLGAEKWEGQRVYDAQFMIMTNFGALVYPVARDNCAQRAANK